MHIELSADQRKALKARAHPLHPTAWIGDKGLTDAVLKEIDVHLKSHELVKVRVASAERDEREAIMASICDQLHATPVQHIGRILVIFRAKPPEPEPARKRKPPRSAARKPGVRKPAAREPGERKAASRKPAIRKPAERKRAGSAAQRITAVRGAAAAPAKGRARTR